MKNFYTLILLICLGLFTQLTSAQLVANDDSVNVNGSGFAMVGPNFFNVRTNDTYNGNSFAAGFVNLTQISTTSSNVNVSGGNIYVQPGTPTGTYTIVYQICLSSNLSVCDTATVTVNVCFVATPTIQPFTCQAPVNSLTINNLPAGNWTLTQRFNNNTDTTISGSGTSYVATGLVDGSYQYKVADASGCTSAFSQNVYTGYLNDGLSGTITGIFIDANTNGSIDVGDQISYQISVTNGLSCTMSNVYFTQFGDAGVVVSGGGFSLAAGQTNSTGLTASYTLTQNDINAGTVTHWVGINADSNGYSLYTKLFTTTDLSIPSGIHLLAFVDVNGNGIQDSGEQPFNNGIFSYELNNNGAPHYLYLYQTGGATFYESNPANTYDITFILSGTCAGEYIAPITSLNNLTVPDNSGITTYYFPVTLAPCTDIGVNLYPYSGNPRPGLGYSQIISYHNYGNQVIPSGTITFTHDPAVTMTPVLGSTPIPNGFTYNFANMMPGETLNIIVEMQVPAIPTVSIGQWLYNSVSVTAPSGDVNPANQVDDLAQMISASYDPNDKVENHGGRILFSDFTSDDYLTYTIRFENTGTANAEKIVLTDVLDTKLDPATVRLVDSSHFTTSMDRVGNTLTITYDGIDLPPSIPNSPVGKGFFVFQVKPKPGYAVGDIISNTANIYFDTNPAIATNVVTTEFVAALGTNQFTLNQLKAYPNPANGVVNLELASGKIDCVSISDVSGKVILTQMPKTISAEINVSMLAKGLYFVKVRSGEKETIAKLVKE